MAPSAPADLDAFVAAHRGRRDGFVWSVGITGLLLFAYGAVKAADYLLYFHAREPHMWVLLAGGVLGVATHLAYLWRRRWSRTAILVPYLVVVIGEGVLARGDTLHGWLFLDLLLVGVLLLALSPAVIAWGSPVTRLAFGVDPPRARLEAEWRRFADNRLAVVALALAVPAAWVPFLFLPVLPLAVAAFVRSREPGVRRGGLAIGALVLCAVGVAVTGVFPALLSLLG